MKVVTNLTSHLTVILLLLSLGFLLQGCGQTSSETVKESQVEAPIQPENPDYFSLRPEIEKTFGYSHAVKVGNIIKISGAVSMDDNGNPTAIGDMGQQIKNCYASLEKILKHYGCTFDDVIVENVYTTDMPKFLENAAYRSTIYARNFPTGTWVGVKELAIPVFMIEIEMEVYKP